MNGFEIMADDWSDIEDEIWSTPEYRGPRIMEPKIANDLSVDEWGVPVGS